MSIRGFEINKGAVGANTSKSEDNICGLIVNAPAVEPASKASGVVLGTVYPLTKLKDAEAMGITALYDSINNVRVHRHIAEFYRMAGEGTKLFLVVSDDMDGFNNMIDEHFQKLIIAAKGAISYVAVAYNPPSTYVPVYIDGLEEIVREAIAKAQEMHEWSWETDRPVNVFLEGRGLNSTGALSLNLRNILDGATLLSATHVTLCIGQDWDYAETQDAIGKKFADVGTLLGTKASISVNRNVGEVETLDISSATKKRWLTAGLSDHKKIEEVDADLSDFDGKGYVFGLSYTGINGIRWNSDHVCAPDIVDENGFMSISTIGYGAAMNKAARMLRKKLLPKLKSTVPVDSATGFLPVGILKYFEGLGNQAFGNMVSAGEISDGVTIVDPLSQLMTGEKRLDVSFVIVPTASIGKIKGVINLKTKI